MTMILRLLGHATFKLTIDDKIIYLDPFGGDDSEYADPADLILASHEHPDHSHPDKIKLIQKKNTLILTSTKNAANLSGNVKTLDPGQKYTFEGITIYGVPAYNVRRFRSSGDPFHPKSIQTAFIIEAKNKRIYFAADTDFIDEMKSLEDIDYALLPIGDTYTMNPTEALDAVGAFMPKTVIPIHWRDQNPKTFKEMVEEKFADVSVEIMAHSTELKLE